MTWFWLACLQCRCGLGDDALRTIAGALEEGHLFRLGRLQDPDLDLIRERPEFKAIELEATRRLAALSRAAELVAVSPAAEDQAPPPLVLFLHGANASLDQFRPYLPVAAGAGWLAVAGQSSQPAGPDAFHWDEPEQALADLATLASLLTAQGLTYDPERVVLAGFSQGGNLALRSALLGQPFVAPGVLGLCPSFPRESRQTLALISAAKDRVRGMFLVGAEEGEWRANAERVHSVLAEAGHQVGLEIVADLAHALPSDFSARLPGLLAIAGGRWARDVGS